MTLIATIDADACAAHGDCVGIAPEAFRLDDVAVVVETGGRRPARRGGTRCPAGAILLYDAGTGEEVDP